MRIYKNTIIWIISVAVLVALVTIPTTLFTRMLHRDIEKFEITINTINQDLTTGSETQKLQEDCRKLEEAWRHHRDHWSFYVHHNMVDTLDLLFAGYLEQARLGNADGALTESVRIRSLLRATEESDRVSWLNIF